MRSVLKIMLANIKSKKDAFKGIIALMAIITFSFAVSLSNRANVNRAVTEGTERAEIGDMIVEFNHGKLTDDMLKAVAESPDIEYYRTETELKLHKPVQIDGTKKSHPNRLRKNYGRIRFFNDECTKIAYDNKKVEKGEIYLPYKMFGDKDVKIGSTLKIQTQNGFDESFTVKGFYEDVVTGSIFFGSYSAVISDEDYDRIFGEKTESYDEPLPFVTAHDNVIMAANEGIKLKDLRTDLNEKCGFFENSEYIFDKAIIENLNSLVANIGTKFVYVFVILLLVIVFITINDSIVSSIEMEYTTLGILKANGFTKEKIKLIFMLQYLIALAIGAFIGIAVSIPATAYLGGQFMRVTALYTENKFSLVPCMLTVTGIIAVCMLFVANAVRGIGKISPVRAIQGGKDDVYFDSLLNVRVRKKPVTFFIALRQITSRLKDYIGSTVIAALLVFFIITIMMLVKGLDFDTIFIVNYGDIITYADVDYNAEVMEDIRSAVTETDKDANVTFELSTNVFIDSERRFTYFYDSEKSFDLPVEGRIPKYDNEVFVTQLLAEYHNKKVGDTITVNLEGKKADFIITGTFQTVREDGRVCEFTFDGAKRLGAESLGCGNITLSDKSKIEEVNNMLNEKFKGSIRADIVEKNEFVDDMKESVNVLMTLTSNAIYVICVIFGAVIVYMVCTKTFRRERKDIGVYKSLGLTSGRLRLQFALRFALVALTGTIIGCLLAMWLTRPILSSLLRIVGLSNFLSDFTAFTFLFPSGLLAGTYFIFAYIASSGVKNVTVRELVTE